MSNCTEKDARKEFWEEVFPKMFSRMNHYQEAVRILDNGSVVDEFISKIFKELKKIK